MALHKILFISVVLTIIVGCGETITAKKHIEQAKAYIIEKQIDESVIELKNAIQKSPKDSEARFLLGSFI